MVDREVVLRRLRELDRRLAALEAIRATTDEQAYRDDFALRTQVERHLQLAVQAAIDITMHLVAEESARVPEDYGDAFTVLAEIGIIDPDLAGRLRAAAGMRNVLVHGYTDVDDTIVWAALGDLADLRSFAAAVVSYAEPA